MRSWLVKADLLASNQRIEGGRILQLKCWEGLDVIWLENGDEQRREATARRAKTGSGHGENEDGAWTWQRQWPSALSAGASSGVYLLSFGQD